MGFGNPLKNLLSPARIKEEVTAFAGGAGGGAIYDVVVGKVSWFQDANWKQLVAAGGLAVIGSGFLKKRSAVMAGGREAFNSASAARPYAFREKSESEA